MVAGFVKRVTRLESTDMKRPYHKLEGELRGRVLGDEPLAKYTSFGIGGPADLLVFPADPDDLREVLRFCALERSPLFPIGNGTDLLVGDEGFRGVVVSLKDGFSTLRAEGDQVICGAGADLSDMLSLTSDLSLSGVEFLAGIPGTVGGAIRRNAGAYGGEVSQFLVSLRGMSREGAVVDLLSDQIKFEYRESRFPQDLIVLEARLRLRRDGPVRQLIQEHLRRREETQPLSERSAGSVFKNPSGLSAGRLIESAGCKGLKAGGAQVSLKHANFIVNVEGASSEDVLNLISEVQEKVRAETGVELQLEIEVIGVE